MWKIKFWGVRGSIPTPGKDTVKFGGNTSCIEMRAGDPEKPHIIIIDAGSGIRLLGNDLLKNDLPKGPLKISLFITHTHWDHIQGFPFFVPNFIKGTELDIYGPVFFEGGDNLEQIFSTQLSYQYFPVRQSELAADLRFHDIKETEFELFPGFTVKTKYLNHPVLCLGYRFEYEGKLVITAFDHEPYRNVFVSDPSDPDYDKSVQEEAEQTVIEANRNMRLFYHGADVLIHDAQYKKKEYESSKLGWGHSPYEEAVNFAHMAKVKQLFLFHHDPMRPDSELEIYESKLKKMMEGHTKMKFQMAYEGLEYQII